MKFINELQTQLKEKGFALHVDESSIDIILAQGYDDKMGARPMSRAIDTMLRMPIAKQITVDNNKNGCKIKIRNVDNKLVIKFRYTDGTITEAGGSEQSVQPSVTA